MVSKSYKNVLSECDKMRDVSNIKNFLVAAVLSGNISKNEAESIWTATRRCPVPSDLRKRLGL